MEAKKKKKWQDFEITKIKLEPEQAVLGACDGGSKPSRSWPVCGGCGGGSYGGGS